MNSEQLWWQKFNEHGEAFEQARPNYHTLEQNSQLIGALVKLELDMYNGGFLQFFCNWGYSAYLLAIKGLQHLQAHDTLALLQQCYAVIEPYQNDARLITLADLADIISEKDEQALDDLEQQYWDDNEHIMERMLDIFGNTNNAK